MGMQIVSVSPPGFLETMDEQDILEQLLDLAEQIGIEVKHEYMGGEGGGICRLRGKWILYVDRQALLSEQLGRTAEALANRKECEDIYLLPQVRAILDEYRR